MSRPAVLSQVTTAVREGVQKCEASESTEGKLRGLIESASIPASILPPRTIHA